ncbi:hypothetical protein Sm713_19480 [Streptomyces sp. TS71-3]|nr:hypothetical protein Sm713_19480 [Streptomyces sp. TS71-3]
MTAALPRHPATAPVPADRRAGVSGGGRAEWVRRREPAPWLCPPRTTPFPDNSPAEHASIPSAALACERDRSYPQDTEGTGEEAGTGNRQSRPTGDGGEASSHNPSNPNSSNLNPSNLNPSNRKTTNQKTTEAEQPHRQRPHHLTGAPS